jgi:DNA processing protein
MTLPPAAYATALASVCGPTVLAERLSEFAPEEAWSRFGSPRVDVESMWAAYASLGVGVHLHSDPASGYPPALRDDHEAPAVLFSKGDLAALVGPRVAVIGSRRCTRYGRDVAFDLGRSLAGSGIHIVSGLALGIDGAAHLGALAAGDGAAPPVAVVGSGLDVVYPRAHRRLWADVAATGLLLSEAPLGARPEPWRFPARNRILAALADVVVVVESRAGGGSHHTVKAADARGKTVLAVPGPVHSASSAYTNELLHMGSGPARDALDVLVALHLECRQPSSSPAAPPPPDDPDQQALLDALGWQPASLEQLVMRSGLGPSQASVALTRLELGGWVVGGGGWWEQVRKERPAK